MKNRLEDSQRLTKTQAQRRCCHRILMPHCINKARIVWLSHLMMNSAVKRTQKVWVRICNNIHSTMEFKWRQELTSQKAAKCLLPTIYTLPLKAWLSLQVFIRDNPFIQGMGHQDGHSENMKPPSYQVPIAGNAAQLSPEAQLYLNGQDRFLPIANIYRIMKNTLHPPKEQRQQAGKKIVNDKSLFEPSFDPSEQRQTTNQR